MGQPWETSIKASTPPTIWATIISSLSKYSMDCLQYKLSYSKPANALKNLFSHLRLFQNLKF
jgi:hypothetical protein